MPDPTFVINLTRLTLLYGAVIQGPFCYQRLAILGGSGISGTLTIAKFPASVRNIDLSSSVEFGGGGVAQCPEVNVQP